MTLDPKRRLAWRLLVQRLRSRPVYRRDFPGQVVASASFCGRMAVFVLTRHLISEPGVELRAVRCSRAALRKRWDEFGDA